MGKAYVWSGRVATAIERLPDRDSPDFWAVVEARDAPPAPEVLAFLIREAYARGATGRAERLFGLLWDRYAPYVLYYARGYQGRLQRALTPDDVAVEAFTLLSGKLRNATGITFYECCFLAGLKRLTLDKVQRMPDEPLVSLTVARDEGEEEEQQDLRDHGAVDPQEHVEGLEQQEWLRRELPSRLHDLPHRAQMTALLLMRSKAEGEIAVALGVSTRMVTNYKHSIRRALAGLEG